MNFLYSLIFTTARAIEITVNPAGGAVSPAPSGSPIQTVSSLYSFALMIAGGLAIAVLVYGGLKYVLSGANPSSKTDAREWITGALWGLLILAGLWIILNLINPNLTVLQLPTLTPLQAPPANPLGDLGPTGVDATVQAQQARTALSAAGVAVKSGVRLDGIKQGTVNEVARLGQVCGQASAGCNVVITSATEGIHKDIGIYTHANGYKVDLRTSGPSDPLDVYITQSGAFAPAGYRNDYGANTAPMYHPIGAASGVIYTRENDHWDVVVK